MKKSGNTITRWLIIVLMLLVIAETTTPPRAHAQYITEDLGVNLSTAGDWITNASSYVSQYSTQIKEYILDPLAWVLAKSLIQQMTGDVVNWINSGFNGSPAFLTNPEGYFSNIGDQITANFISDNGALSSLCSPFSIDVRLALALEQVGSSGGSGGGSNNRYTCTLNSIIQNVQNSTVNGMSMSGFMNGDFSQGGWPAFIALSEPQNNEAGAYLQAHSDVNQQIGAKQAMVQQQLLQGSGFLSWQDCKDVSSDFQASTANGGLGVDSTSVYGTLALDASQPTGPMYSQSTNASSVSIDPQNGNTQTCETKTPGSVISASLNKSLGAGQDSLVTADEIDEVIGALIGQLVNQVLTTGLSSVSQKSSNETQSFIDRMANEPDPNIQATAQGLIDSVGQYVTTATDYKSVRDQIVGVFNDLNSFYVSLVTQCQSAGNASAASSAQGILDSQVTQLLAQAQTQDDQAASSLATLTDIQTAATSGDANSLNQNAQQFSSMLQSGQVITNIDVKNAKDDLKTAQKTAASLRAQGVPYQMMCASGSTTGTSTITTMPPVISSVDSTGVITGQNFTYTTRVYVVSSVNIGGSTVTTGTTDLSFTATSNTSLSVDLGSANITSGDNKLYVVNPGGTSAPYSISIAQ